MTHSRKKIAPLSSITESPQTTATVINEIAICQSAYAMLTELSRLEKFVATDKAKYIESLKNFPVFIGPVIGDVSNILIQLNTLSNKIYEMDTGNLHGDLLNPILSQVIVTSVLLTQELAQLSTKDRQKKLAALKSVIEAINDIFEFPRSPVGQHNLNTERLNERKQDIFKSLLTSRSELEKIFATTFLSRTSQDKKATSLVLDLQESLANLKEAYLDPTYPLSPIPPKTTEVIADFFKVECNSKIGSYQDFAQRLDNLSQVNNTCKVRLLPLKKIENYEVINTRYFSEFNELLTQLKELEPATLLNSALSKQRAIIFENAVLLTQKWGENTNHASYTNRREKIIALSGVISSILNYPSNPSAHVKGELDNATWKLRYLIEGSYFNRTENKLITGILSAVTTAVAITAAVVSAMLLLHFAPVLAPLTFALAAVGCGLGFITLTSISASLAKLSCASTNPKEQDNSRKIYQNTRNLSLFNSETKKVEAKEEQPAKKHLARPMTI